LFSSQGAGWGKTIVRSFAARLSVAALCAATGIAAQAAGSAQAATLNWTLHDVTFDDGGSASGTFSTDSTTGDVIAFDITTSAGTTLGGITYDWVTSLLLGDDIATSNSFMIATRNLDYYLEFAFANPLTSGGVDALVTSGEPDGSWECNNCSPMRDVTGGFASTAPEPASWALMLVGFGALGLGLRTTRKSAPASV
jgi:PEP-CTERM motif